MARRRVRQEVGTSGLRVTHYARRRVMAFTVHRILTIGFVVIVGLVLVGVLVSLVAGQDHPFPFKTLEYLTIGTSAWPLQGPPQMRSCPTNTDMVQVAKYQYQSGAGSGWVVYTDGVLFAAAYFPPDAEVPVTIVVGHIADGKRVVIETHEPYTPGRQTPCTRW